MNCPTPSPTKAGFIEFLRNNVGISAATLPDDSIDIEMCYCQALRYCNNEMGLKCAPVYYTRTVYNCAASLIINTASDQPGQTFFKDLRKQLGLNSLPTGLLNSAADQGTSASKEISNTLKNLTLQDLMMLKDPYGQQVVATLQQFGNHWGYTP